MYTINIGDNINKYFPGFYFISRKVIFITYKEGYVAVDKQVVFGRPSRETLEGRDKNRLQIEMKDFGLDFEKTTIFLMLPKA